jgi:DNA-binding MarR family transcriptional regulator
VSVGNDLHGTGAHLSPRQLLAWTQFLDASRLLEERLARHLADNHDMSHGEYEILVRLDGAGGAMRIGEIADECVAPRPRISQTLKRVEARGWITRRADETDGRGSIAELTPEGDAALVASAAEHAEIITEHLLEPLSDTELDALGLLMERVAIGLRSVRGMNV